MGVFMRKKFSAASIRHVVRYSYFFRSCCNYHQNKNLVCRRYNKRSVLITAFDLWLLLEDEPLYRCLQISTMNMEALICLRLSNNILLT